MRTSLELIRIVFLFFIVIGVASFLKNSIYLKMGIDEEKYAGIGFVAIFLLFFVLYRNKLQFSGWYKGEGRERLPRKVSRLLIITAVGFLLLPIALSFLG